MALALCIFGALHTTGAHAGAIFVFFNVHAALAMLNHSPNDVAFTLPKLPPALGAQYWGFAYSVRAHEMHHRKFTKNYAQYWMGMDRIMGTFTEYDAIVSAAQAAKQHAS